jgi:hypothetical protein
VLHSADDNRWCARGDQYVMTVEDFRGVPAARAYLENLLASPLLFPGGWQA